MGTQLSKVLDACIARVSNNRTIETCLAEYPTMREQLEPLLYTALSFATMPKVSPSDEFRKKSKIRLMARLREDCVQAEAVKSSRRTSEPTGLAGMWQGLVHTIAGSRRVAIPLGVSLLLVLVGVLPIFGMPNFTSTPAALECKCTLSIISGSVETQKPGSAIWEQAQDSITLEAGSRVRTAEASQAVLTFFEGSTLKLEANTDIEIQRVEYTEEQRTIIILSQWLGRTWSRVVKMVDPGSHYEIQTPSASAIVRGTLFMTEVDEAGLTTVQTIEGLVVVDAQAEEVNVPAGYGTIVEFGAAPSEPTIIEAPAQGSNGEGPPGHIEGGPPGQGPDGEGPPGWSEGHPGKGPEGEGPPGWSEGHPGKGPEGEGPPGWSEGGPPGQSESGPPGQGPGGEGPPGQNKDEPPGQGPKGKPK